jgi:hypothetical protein
MKGLSRRYFDMTCLRDLFPLLKDLPAAAIERGLSLDSSMDEFRAVMNSDAGSRAVSSFVGHLLEHEDEQLGVLLPGLRDHPHVPIGPYLRTNRARNALQRAGITTFADLSSLSPKVIRMLPYVGALTVGDILARAVEGCALPASAAEGGADDEDVIDRVPVSVAQAARALRVMASWAARERNLRRLGDVLRLNPDGGVLPPSLMTVWQQFVELDPSDIADPELVDSPLGDLLTELLDLLEPAQRSVYELRVLTASPLTLE